MRAEIAVGGHDQDARALLSQPSGGGAADALVPAGDDRDMESISAEEDAYRCADLGDVAGGLELERELHDVVALLIGHEQPLT